MSSRLRICLALLPVVLCLTVPISGQAGESAGQTDVASSDLIVQVEGADTTLSLEVGAPFHRTGNAVVNARRIDVPASSVRLALWAEELANGQVVPFYAISLDGRNVKTVRRTSYVLKVRHGDFDPGVWVPPVAAPLTAGEATNLYIVQFVTQPLEEFRTAIESLGGTVYQFLANHAHFVKMTPQVRKAVAQLPFVRWVGPVQPAHKLEEEIRDQILAGANVAPRRYSIMNFERGTAAQDRVCGRIEAFGGEVHGTTPRGFRIEATLPLDQVCEIAALDDVMFIDRKGELELDMDIVREIGGADFIENTLGFTGQGVRGEVADTELNVNHIEWSAPPIIHLPGSGTAHGTSVYSILFAQGVNPQARGLIPDGVGIFAQSSSLLGGGPTRYQHTAELVDPDGPYRAVFQTNSTGDPRTTQYTTISAEMDDILFLNDIVICQSQSNAGGSSVPRDSRPQAWAKNIVSGGAVNHLNTLDRSDDRWLSPSTGTGTSTGPAADGRVKPTLAGFYDYIEAARASGGYTQFGGTSGGTPIVAGHIGLVHQMWHEGVFEGFGGGATVFDSRPHMTTAKALLVNTAHRYDWNAGGHNASLDRFKQGWGWPDIEELYNMQGNISIINETELLTNMDHFASIAFVTASEPLLRATLVYADPPGTPYSSQHRVNDLSLKLTSPSGAVYWGNNGLLEDNWSVPGGAANVIDTVENVFIQGPEAGVWLVEVLASEINEDGHVETPQSDADFALVVTGSLLPNCTPAGRINLDQPRYACVDEVGIRVVDCDLNTDDNVIETVTITIESPTEPTGESVVLTETSADTADFRGSIELSIVDAPGVLQISEFDIITATYIDADDGQGGTNVVVTAQGKVDLDCQSPVISDVQVAEVDVDAATVTFVTDEPAIGTVRYGLACGTLTESVTETDLDTSHVLVLAGLTEASEYFFAVDAADEYGNASTDDNGGVCYSFITLAVVLADDFEADQGWTVVNLGATGGDWQRGVPINDPDWDYDPVSDSDGSGQCYVTQNEMGDTDVDDGAVRLISPTLDMSAGDVTIDYDYFLRLTEAAGGVDRLLVEIDGNDGAGPWTEIARHDTDNGLDWQHHAIDQADLDAAGVALTSTMKLRFTANDDEPQSIVESGLDAVLITGFGGAVQATCEDGVQNQGEDRIDCGGPCPPCDCVSNGECNDELFCTGVETCDDHGHCDAGEYPCGAGAWCHEGDDACIPHGNGDFDTDGDVDLGDFADFQVCFGEPAGLGCEPGNMTGTDAVIDLDDFAAFVAALNGPQ